MTRKDELVNFWQHIVAGYSSGTTALPPFMGLSDMHFNKLIAELTSQAITTPDKIIHDSGKHLVYQDLLSLKESEFSEVINLLSENVTQKGCYTGEAVRVIACACMGSSHLWSDLGLPERPVLGEMIRFYFPELHKKNTDNMRWKRFFYKQLCEQGGDYICRAPSCETCSSYDECFV